MGEIVHDHAQQAEMYSKRNTFPFYTIYNQSYCDVFIIVIIFNLIFKYNKWAGDHVYPRTGHETLT